MFTSYAQNFEDVMLWRALKHVENGVYIDVGAQHPVIDSVSLAFYEHDWRGVHVEPSAHYAQLLRDTRPDETVIQAAVNGKGAVLKFYEIPETGLSTCNADIAEQHRASGFTIIETSVPCVTLANIFESCAECEIHWLKIDVEGLEEQVLQGWMPSKARPWIVVVESTLPSTQIESHDKWEKLILDLDYKFVYFDGLNRFYLAKKHPELEDAFRAGPNVFDGFVLSGTASSPFCALLNDSLASREQEFSAQVIQGQAEFQRLTLTLATREQELSAQISHEQNEVLRLTQTLATREEELGTQVAQGQAEFQRLTLMLATREQELSARITHRQNEVLRLTQTLATREEELGAQVAQVQAEFQRLTKMLAIREEELSAQVTQGQNEVLRLTQKLGIREQELGVQVSQGHAELAEARARLDARSEELTASQERAQWLENEWNAAKVKIDELNHSSHHWWTVADGLSRELQTVYVSRSWRLTEPLREVNRHINHTKRMAWYGVVSVISLPRRGVRWMLLSALKYVQARQEFKTKVVHLLAHFPRLNTHLRAFASARAPKSPVAFVQSPVMQAALVLSPELPKEASADIIQWAAYSPSVRNVYNQLMQARASVPADTPQNKITEHAA